MYKDPQALDKWEIKDAGWVTAVRESDGRQVQGWFEGSVLTLQYNAPQEYKASLWRHMLEWETGATSWIKE